MSMDNTFTTAIIWACKRAFGAPLDLKAVLAEVAGTEIGNITEAHVIQHLAEAVATVGRIGSQRRAIEELLFAALVDPVQQSRARALLALTTVDELRELGLLEPAQRGLRR